MQAAHHAIINRIANAELTERTIAMDRNKAPQRQGFNSC